MKNKDIINNDSFELIDYRDKFFRISNKIFDENLDVYEIGIYTVLCRFANNQSSMSYPSITKICKMLKISRPKTITTINKLAEKAIILKKQGNTGFANRYYLKNLPSKQHLLCNDIDGVVNDVDGVVNDVYPIKTNKKDSKKKTQSESNNYDKEINNILNIYIRYRKELGLTNYLTSEKKNIYLNIFNKEIDTRNTYSYRLKILSLHKMKDTIKKHGGFFEKEYIENCQEAIGEYNRNVLYKQPRPIYDIKSKKFIELKDKSIDRFKYVKLIEAKGKKLGDVL